MKIRKDWQDVPFWFSWLVWSWWLLLPAFLGATLYAQLVYDPGPGIVFVVSLVGAIGGGFISATVSRKWGYN